MWHIPVKTDWMLEQSKHIPSMDYARDIYTACSDLVVAPKALEIGGAWGFSTLAILSAGAKSLITVDPNELAEAANEARANDFTKHEWIKKRSEEFWKENNDTFNLIYVDGSHLYDDVKNDLYEAWKVLNEDGILMIDDWDHYKNIEVDDNGKFSEYGVSLACLEFWRDHIVVMEGIQGRVLWFKK